MTDWHLTQLVWAYDPSIDGHYHLMPRNSEGGPLHTTRCDLTLNYPTTRYVEQRPMHEERICPACAAHALAHHESYP